MAKTFLQARAEIAETLRAHGWSLSPALKVPYATSPSGALRLWFKPQAVYFTEGNYHTLNGARTISYELDIRKMTGESFVEYIRRRFPEVSRDMTTRARNPERGFKWKQDGYLHFAHGPEGMWTIEQHRGRFLLSLDLPGAHRGGAGQDFGAHATLKKAKAEAWRAHRSLRTQERDEPRRSRRDRERHVRELHIPKGGATHKRTLSEFTAEVKALLFTRGFGPYLIDQLIAPNYEVLQAAWRQGKAPCAVSDFFASKMKGRRDPAKLSAKDLARAKKLEVFAMVNGFSHLSDEELELVRRLRGEREAGKQRRQARRKR